MSYDETTQRPDSADSPDSTNAPDSTNDAERDLRDLLRSAGPRPDLPRDDLLRVREAARGAWRERYLDSANARRSPWGRRALALAATLALALVGVWLWLRDGSSGEGLLEPVRVAVVETIDGSLLQVVGGRTRGEPLALGDPISAPAEYVVSEGVVALRMTSGESVRLASSSRIRALSAERLELLRGSLYVDSEPSSGAGELKIVTPAGIVSELGTQYLLRLNAETGSLFVAVREGAIVLSENGASHQARVGEALTVAADGSTAREAIAASGPIWSWVTAAARPIEIEGRSLADFLDWVGRETGWRVRFADPALERAATEILLHGSVGDLRPDEESVAVAVAGSGLEYRLDEGVLEIRRSADAGPSSL